jgi:hypothetical protein
MLTIEIQRGKEPMRQQAYQVELGATAARSRRLCEGTAYSGCKFASRQDAAIEGAPESFLGDSWFTGVRVAEWAASNGHSYFGALKTSTKFTPYQELLAKMADWPSGSNLVMECTSPNAHRLICIGYKYSASKVLVFLGTKNAGSTKDGEPYVARFPDANGNVAQRNVPRPDVISKYFNDSNVIDSHNQARQYELALEKRWITHNGWMRIATTVIGITVTDAWRAFKHAMPLKKHKEITLKEFADRIAFDCIYNSYPNTVSINGYLPSVEDDVVPQTVRGPDDDTISTVTAPTSHTSVADDHVFIKNYELEHYTVKGEPKARPKRRACRAEGCSFPSPWRCSNQRCERFRYKCGAGYKYGVFYCPALC